MSKNICRFIPNQGNESDINILNFVHETKEQISSNIKYETTYKIHIVTKGKGKIFISDKFHNLNYGDIFFTFPTMEYSLQSENDFEYMYISFMGIRTNKLLEKLKISKENFLFKNQKKLLPIWTESIVDNKSVFSLRCEGIILYSFSVLSEHVIENNTKNNTLTEKVKNYIDEHFTEEKLSLEIISKIFSYNKKYVSTAFKKDFHIGLTQYITNLRIQYACTLMEQGFSSVSDIAYQCGFSEAQYFSKVFKAKMGVSPKEHINSLKNIS